MKKRLLTSLLAVCLMLSLSVPAWAVDGDEATGPNESTTTVNKAEMNGDGTNFTTANDDDNVAATDNPADTDGAQLYVWAQVRNVNTPSYKIDIEWGAMMFEFVGDGGLWDPDTHTMSDDSVKAAWSVNDGKAADPYVYLPADAEDDDTTIVNNEIQVTNHSNSIVYASFALGNLGAVFNEDGDADKVVGKFYASADAAKNAATVLTNTGSISADLNELELESAVATTAEEAAGATTGKARPGSVYFAFSGTPNSARGGTMYEFDKVGAITVTISKDAPNPPAPEG